MKRMLLVLGATALLALTPHSPVFTENDAGAPITVRAGEEFFIALASNQSTGYAWTQHLDDGKIAAYEGNVVENASPAMPGAPGQQIFIYHANRSGTTTISFDYARPFDANAQPAKHVLFTVTVR